MTDVFVNIGDTVHITDTAAVDATPDQRALTPVPSASVADLLTQSRSAHQRFQQAAGHNDGRGKIRHPDESSAALAIRDALTARRAAEDADPTHADRAWIDDATWLRGVSSQTMIAFYEDYFAPDQPL